MLQLPTPSHIMNPFHRLNAYAQSSQQDIHTVTERRPSPANMPLWVAILTIDGITYEAVGPNIREAKNHAALLALQDLGVNTTT
ncbi:hypothetical protein BJ165DRAFT_1510434 [Panaeolus papilionaceus]|nr:hypothetical protein BJ165DRAFT_1510434 [Panaeolus papilionaceus]